MGPSVGEQAQARSHDLSVLLVLRPSAGGMRRHVAQLCRGLPTFGVRCEVAGPATALEELDERTRRMTIPIAAGTRPVADLLAAARLAEIGRGFHLLHAHGLRAAWVSAWASMLARRPLIVTLHNVPEADRPLVRRALSFSLRRAACVITVSEAIAASLGSRAHHQIPVVVIPNGVEVPEPSALLDQAEARSTVGLRLDVPAILAVGRLEREKGYDVLIAATRELTRRTDLQVCIVGEGSERTALEKQVRSYGLSGVVRLAGHQTNLMPWYRAADIVAVPSRSEGQGLVALEAMAHARPVVASATGGLPEVVVDGETGLLVPREDPQAMARALDLLLANEQRRRAMGGAGRRRVREKFLLAEMLRRTAETYRRIA